MRVMRKLSILSSIACLILSGCSKEDSLISSSGKNELGVSASINKNISTRSLTDAFSNGDQIAVFITGGTAPNAYTPQVAAYTYNAGTSSWLSGSSKIYLSNIQATVYGFYPANASYAALTNNDSNTLSISLSATEDSFNGTNQKDYMYATGRSGSGTAGDPYVFAQPTADNQNNKADLYFHHALSKLSFVVSKGNSYNGTGLLTNLTLTTQGASPYFNVGTATMTIKDGSLTWAGTTSSQLTFSGMATINDYGAASPAVSVYGLVSPRTDNSGGITLSLTIDGKTMSANLPIASPADHWIAGSNYTYTVTINGTELLVNSVSILPWDEITGGDVVLN